MIIRNKRIRTVKAHLPGGLLNEEIYVCVPAKDVAVELLKKIGFTDFIVGQQVVPAPRFKRVAFFNAEGGFIRRRDLPKETVYSEREWTWEDYQGNEYSKTVYVPHQRYPRDPIAAPEESLSIVNNTMGEMLIVSKAIRYTGDNEGRIKHVVNLCLEIFGFCEIRNSRLDAIIEAPVIRLNWDVLPKGATCWPSLMNSLTPIINTRVKPGIRKIVTDRLLKLNNLNPDFVAIGNGGFYGYVIFGFKDKNRYVLESVYSGNAIYVLGKDWESISQLSKSEILRSGFQVARIVHAEGYWNQLRKYVA